MTDFNLTWVDSDGVKHAVGLAGATTTLAKFYERWPGGWSEVEAEDLARSNKKDEPLAPGFNLPAPDIFVTNATGQAWGGETNPEMGNDPECSPYYSLEQVQHLIATSTETINRLKMLMNEAYGPAGVSDTPHLDKLIHQLTTGGFMANSTDDLTLVLKAAADHASTKQTDRMNLARIAVLEENLAAYQTCFKLADDANRELEQANEHLREQNEMIDQACAQLERVNDQLRETQLWQAQRISQHMDRIADLEAAQPKITPAIRVWGWVWKDKLHEDGCCYIPCYTPDLPSRRGELLALVHPNDLHQPLERTMWHSGVPIK